MHQQLKEWVESNGHVVQSEEKFKVYELKTVTKFEDKKNKVRVLNIGPENDLEVKAVLLLGETGVGKTTFLNVILNAIFGVDIGDSIRLRLKDQMDTEKASTQSQTEYTTAFTIYHQEGMPFPYNYMIIDTPGLGDTEGDQKDQLNENCLRFYLTNENHIKHINGVGLVWKSSNQKLDTRNKEILTRIRSLLGFDIKAITDVLLTFSAFDEDDALSVISASGMDYNGVFHFENNPIYQCPTKPEKQKMHAFMWESMMESHHNFLMELNQRQPKDLKITSRLLLAQVKLQATERRLRALDQSSNFTSNQLESQQAKLIALNDEMFKVDWDKIEELDTSSEEIFLDDGRHCHYCRDCRKVCIPACTSTHQTGDFAAVACDTSERFSPQECGERVVDTVDKVNQHMQVFASTATGTVGKIAKTIVQVATVVVQVGKMILGAIRTVLSEGKTQALHAAEGEQQCHKCGHFVNKHEIRDKVLAKEANFEQKMELLKKKKYQEVMGQKVDLKEEIEATQKRIEQYDKIREQELKELEETTMEVEQLQKGV